MCINCVKRNENRKEVLSHADEIADVAAMTVSEITTIPAALEMAGKLKDLSNKGLLNLPNLFLLVAHFAEKAKALDLDNKRLHEALNYMSETKLAEEDKTKKILPADALRLIEGVIDTFENAQARAMEGANAQIRELKNRYCLNK